MSTVQFKLTGNESLTGSNPALRSSVRPRRSKLPWGTIIKPEFDLGTQRLTSYEIEQAVARLYYIPNRRSGAGEAQLFDSRKARLTSAEVNQMVARLTKTKRPGGPADSNRTLRASSYKDMGVVASYAWRGYN